MALYSHSRARFGCIVLLVTWALALALGGRVGPSCQPALRCVPLLEASVAGARQAPPAFQRLSVPMEWSAHAHGRGRYAYSTNFDRVVLHCHVQ